MQRKNQIPSSARRPVFWHYLGSRARHRWLREEALRKNEALQKYSPDQPRVPAGNPDGGQWTRDGGGADGAVLAYLDDGEPVVYTGETIWDSRGSILLQSGQVLMMPKDVSLAENAILGEKIKHLPSILSAETIPTILTGNIPLRELAMAELFAPGQKLDYQRTRSRTDKINKTYINFGNYNFGVVAAAAGYDLGTTLVASGVANLWGKGDRSGPFHNNPRNMPWIIMGYNDYKNGRIIKHR